MAHDSADAAPSEDIDLARAFITGDDAAFEAFYRRYARPVHDYALGIVRDRSLAEDITQTTFLRAYEQRSSVRDPAAVRAWLYRIAHNVAINQVSRTVRTEEIPEDAPLPAAGPGPEQLVEQDEAVRLVWDAAASLEARQFTVLDLALRKGLSSAEIGTVLGLDPAQASLALHRAREALGNAVRYLVVARRRRHCERLAELVPAGVRSLSAEQRASVDRHIRRCPACQRAALALTAPGELFGAIPIAVLPAGLLEWRALAGTAGTPGYTQAAHVARSASKLARRTTSWTPLGTAAAVTTAVGVLIAGVLVVISAVGHHSPPRRIVGPPASTSPTASNATFAPAPLRGQIVFRTAALGQAAIGEINPDGSNTHQVRVGGVLCCSGAALSPDGSRVVLAGEGAISVANADGTGAHPIWTTAIDVVTALAWSPTGQQIAFSAGGTSTTAISVIYTVNVDGSGLRGVAHGINIGALAWSPDSTQIAFTQGQANIWAVAATGGPTHILFGPSQGEGSDELPGSLSWAPASSLLFFALGSTQPVGIWHLNANGTGLRLVLPGATSPSWGLDGSHFAAVLDGRIVIATVKSGVEHTIGPPGVKDVSWVGLP